MGLDSVELLIAVEKLFEIQIPDDVAEKLTTVGALHQEVVESLYRLERPGVEPAIVWDLLRNIICMQLGVKPEQVTPQARFVEDLRID